MRTVVVRLNDADLSSQMAAMREWLDLNRCQPARFVYDQSGDALVISVAFSDATEAKAFAARFDGHEAAQFVAPLSESRPAEVDRRSA
jgi:hypothetical protein